MLVLFLLLLLLIVSVCACTRQETNEDYTCKQCEGKSMKLYTFVCTNQSNIDEEISNFQKSHPYAIITDYETQIDADGMINRIYVAVKYYE